MIEQGWKEEPMQSIMLSKGLHLRTPHISVQKQVGIVQKLGFLSGWFGERRPFNAVDGLLFFNMTHNAWGELLLTGFSQVAKDQKVRNHMVRGRDIAKKQIDVCGSILRTDDLSVSAFHFLEVPDSTEAPCSNKLMTFFTTSLISGGIAYYGSGLGLAAWRDLATHYARLITEVGQYAEDGANLMIEKDWMEQPPLAADRIDLAQGKRG